jgi:metallo-beta-lactamase class B
MTMRVIGLAAALIASALPPSTVAAQDGNEPAAPFRIADNLYFVGSSDIGSYLITTPAGHILIDAGY